MARSAMNRIHVTTRAMLPALAVLVALGLSGCASSGGAAPSSTAGGQKGAASSGGTTSQNPTAPATGAAPQACAVVTKQEAENLVGTSLQSPVAAAEKCVYTAPTTGPSAQVEVFVGETAKNYLAAERGIGHELQPLSGIGDEAYIEDYAVFVNKHDFWVSVDLVGGKGPTENRGPLENLARTVAARI